MDIAAVSDIVRFGEGTAVSSVIVMATTAGGSSVKGRRGEEIFPMKNMNLFALVGFSAALGLMGVTGCATKNYVHSQTQPLVDQAGQLDEKTATNNRNLHDVDDRATAGIGRAQGSANTATTNAQSAAKAAEDAEFAATGVVHRADSLESVIKGLDDYKPTGDVSVVFGFDKAVLTKADRAELDSFASQISSAKGFILEVTGGTDSTGPAQYNYELSQRRADAVVQYLASKYQIPAHRFYLIGIGKDKEVAPNTTAEGRKQNRRVEIRLLTNTGIQAAAAQSSGGM